MPNKYYIDRKNNLRQVPKEKEADFLKKYPGSREATSKELSDFEDMMFRKRQSNEGEAGIQKEQNSSTTKLPANNPLMGNQFGFDVPNYSEQFKPENYKIDLRQPDNTPTKIFSGDSPFASKTLEQTINDTRKNMPISPEAYFDMAIDRYKSEKEHIEQIKNDNTIPESVKQSLIKDYQENIRTSDDLTVEDKNLPPAARDWLERNKVERQVVQYMPSIMGGGSYTTTVRENTPEQIAFIKDYIANSAEGKRYAQAHKEWIEGLEKEIDPLIKQGESVIGREVRKHQDKLINDPSYYYQRGSRNPSFPSDRLVYGNKEYTLASKAVALLKNAKSLLSANREGGGFWKGLKPSAQEAGEFIAMSEFLGDARLNEVINKYEQDPESLTDEEKVVIQAKYIADQINAGVDPGSWYNIGATTKQSLPFMRDFIMTAPIGGGAGSLVKGGASALASKTGLNFLLSRGAGPLASKLAKGAIDLSVRPAVQTMFSPSSYAMAFQEMQGQAVDRDDQGEVSFDNRKDFGHGVTSAFIENQSEVLGEVVLDKLFQRLRIPIPAFLKTNAAKRLSSATGIQGPITEYAEEKYADLANIVRGEQTIEGFFDPRQNLETFGAVAIMQIPFSAIKGTGYGIGKIRDVQAKRAIRQTYDKSRSNLIEFFGEDAEIATESFNNLVDNSTEEELKNELQSVIEDERLDDNAKRAIVEYVTSYSAYSGINKAKQEQIQQAQEEATQRLQENINPQMNAVVSAVVAGFDKPIQIVGGNIVQREDGSIDREASDKQIFYIDPNDGSRKVIAIDFVENIDENILSEDAAIQLSERVAEEVTAEYENDEVREHQQGEVVRVSLDGNSFVVGQIEGRDEATGDYILTIQTPNGVQQMPVQPRHIVNEDNLIGVENESLVNYINEQGEKVQGVVATNVDLYAQGLIGFENGDTVPVENVIGLVDESAPEEISNSQETAEIPDQNNQSVTTAPSEQNILSLDQIPKDKKGNILFESVSVENTLSALGEVYDSTEITSVVDATIANIEKQVEKAKSPKPTGDITKDIANKQKANQELKSLNNRLAYWNDVKSAIQASKPIEQQVTEQLTGEEYTPQNRENEHLWNVAENSDNPIDIANAYNEAMQFAGEETLQPWEQELLGRRVNRASFEMFGDRNWINGTIARAWFNRKGEESNTGSIDIIAQELGTDVQSIVEFIVSHPSNRIKQGNELTDALNTKFKELAKEITGREVGGIESNSGKLFLATMEYAAKNTPTEAEMTLAESNAVLDIPQPVQFFLNDYMGIYEMANFNQFREAVEEADAQGYFMFPLEPKDKEVILNYIDYAEQQANTVRDSNEELSSKPTIEDGEKIVSLNPEKTLTDEQREEISQSIPQGTGSQSIEADSGDGIHQRVSQRADREGLSTDSTERATIERNRSTEETGDSRQDSDSTGDRINLLDEIAQAEAETDTNPTEAQKEAGNYKKGKVTIQGFGITIEQPQGSVRSGVDANGKEWSVTMNNTYGYIRGTEGKDGDHIDVFLGNNPESKKVFVIDQVRSADTNKNNQSNTLELPKVEGNVYYTASKQGNKFTRTENSSEDTFFMITETSPGVGVVETVNKNSDIFIARRAFVDENITKVGLGNHITESKLITLKRGEVKRNAEGEWVVTSPMIVAFHGNRITEQNLLDLKNNGFSNLKREPVFDEHKVMLGFDSIEEAREAYLSNYEEGWQGLGNITQVDVDTFRKWTESDTRRIKPFAEYKEIQESTPTYGSSNSVFTQNAYEEAKKKLRDKLNNMNSGFDPEMILLSTQVAGYHIEAGVRKLADLAARMIDDLGDGIRPYIKSAYESVRYYPGMADVAKEMDSIDYVMSFDIENFDKEIKKENEQSTERSTETIESQTRTIAEISDAIRNRAEDAKNSEQAAIIIEDISEAKEEIESLLASIDKKLENLRMTDKSYSTEGIAADYPINVLAKGEIKRDATKFVKAVAKMADLEFDTNRKGKKEIVNVNIPPAGGDISFILWIKDNPDVGVYVSFSIDPEWINDRGGYEDYRVRMPKNSFDFMNRTLYRLTTKEDKYRGLGNQFVSPDITAKELAEKMVKDLNQYLGKKTEVNKVNSSKNEELSLKKVVKQSGLSQQLSIFDDVQSNNNEYGTEPRILQTNNNRLPRTERAESVQGVERRQLSGRSSREQSETISKDDGAQRQSTRREGSVLQRDADLLEPALVEYNIEDNDVESFNQSKKYDDNIAAIEVVVDALKNKRKVTPAEKEILSKYVGFGGLKDILYSPDNESSWTKTNSRYREQVRKIIELSKEVDSLTGKDTTLSDIRGSILNAHYTSSTVIRAMYDGLTKLGFKGGRVLEPSAGIGNFISYMPKHIQKNSSVTAVELDNLTGNILRLIHDDADTRISGIQDVAIPDNSQDLVISNIPFGNYRIYDKAYKGEKEKFLNRIHNYFFIKALDKAREGGIVALVTSKGVLDSPGNQDVREYLNSHANFLGAVRLPNTTFKNVANTEVVTDIIFLQKNTQSQTNNEDFISIEKVEAVHKDGEIQEVGINNYFSKHPNNMLGEIEAGGLYSRDDYTLKDNGTSENLNKIIKDLLPKDIFKPVESGAGLQANDITRTILEVKQGNIFFNDGKLYRNQEGQAEEIKINEPQAKLESYISLRDTLMDLIYSEYIGKPDSEVEALRNDLNKQYDAFTKKYGKLEKSLPKIARQDADGYNVLSLENEGQKADIFSKRTIAPISTNNRAENIDEAIVMSLYENASIDIERIAELLNLPLDETIALSKGKLFQEPVTGQFVTREEYLSGNVKKKLKEAKQAVDSGYTEFTNNVTELEKVIPADIPAVHIEARMGSRWIPAEIYSQFAKELLNSDSASVTYSKSTDTYYDSGKVNTVEATNKYGTGRVNGMDIIIKALMISPPKVYDTHKENGKDVRVLNVQETSKANEKYEDVRNAFEDWVYRDLSRRELLSGIYNERYNTTVKRTYNGDHLNVPGINGVNLRPHQKDAVWMLLQNNGGIIDHLVGAGKTFVMIAAAQEMRRTGIAKKPMITALKSTIPQIVESYRSAYPMAKILAPTEKDFQKENRRKLFSKIANNEWDCIIMSHENYGKIPHELDIQRKFVQDEIDEIESERVQMEIDGASKQAIKGLETRIKNLEARLEKLADLDKDNSITFQQMGIDHIIVDESQQFKNLSYVTKQRGVAGLGKPEGSKRAFNLFMGIRYLQEKYNADKGTTFLSGTPISNSMVEMYTLLKYLRPSKLQELNMTSFDAWATTFAVPTSDIEFTVTGDFKQKTRFREFINVPELSLMYTEIADIRTDDNLKLDKPKMKGGGYTVETIQMNDEQIEFGQALMEFARTKDGTVIGRGPLGEKEKTAAMLIATNLSSKMAIDMRLIDPSYSYDPNGKIAKTVENVYRIYNETNDFLGTQLIFSDLGTPKNTKSKSGLLRDYMEDELGANIDTLNEIFGDPNVAGFRFPSIKTVTNKIVEVLEMSESEVADMIQEAENSVGGFNVYDEVKLRLIEKGVPENQIVFIHDYNTQRQKEKLFEQVNNGQIRIILGSTQKLGTGVNVQERASAIHHIDVPWTPAAMEQRNGRVIRQGNRAAKEYLNNEVPIYAYATERTLDAYKYQLLQTKQHFLNQVKSGSIEDRVVKESDADSESGVSYAELVAMLSGNQDILLKSKLEGQLDKLKRAKRNFEGELYEAIDKRDNLISKVPSIQSNIELTRQNIESLTNNIKLDKDGKLIIDTINGEKIKKPAKDKKTVERIDYGKKAIDIINKNTSFATNSLNLGGYEIEYSASSLLEDQKVITNLVADNGVRYTVGFSSTPGIFLNNLQKTIEGIPSILEKQEATLEKNLKDTKAYDEIINRGHNWEKQSEYDRVQQELKEVLDRLKETEVKEETTVDDVEETEDIIVDETNFTEHAAQVAREVVPVEETKETTEEDTDKELLASPATEYKHTKTGNIHGLVKLNKELPREEYLQVARIARKHKGKWSNYTKGFLFYDTDNANKFSEEVNKSDIRYQQSGEAFIPLDDAQAKELIKLLKKTGLARDVVTDKAAFDAKLDEVINDNAIAKQVLSEMETIKQEATANGTFMLAPNGQQSNLNENQWLQVRTKPFLDWFGDWINSPGSASKVVDENGEPMVVYHGSRKNVDFNEFDPLEGNPALNGGMYFSNSKELSRKFAGTNGKIYEVYLKIEDPRYDTFTGSGADMSKSIYRDGGIFTKRNTDRYANEGDKEYIVFQPIQIKSAISNTGAFDSSNPDIRMQVMEDSSINFRDVLQTLENQHKFTFPKIDTEKIFANKRSVIPNHVYKDISDKIENPDSITSKTVSVADIVPTQKNINASNLESVSDVSTIEGDNPVIVVLSKGKYYVVDGHHRISNAILKGEETVEVLSIEDAPQFMRTPQGEIYGFVTPEGEVYLDSTRMNANTPIHEFGHLWNDYIKKNNPELYQRGVELIKQSPYYWERIYNNPAYSNLSEEAKIDEALAMAYGDKGESFYNRSMKQRFIDWLADVWKSIKKAFGINTDVAVEDMSLSDFTDRAVNELLGGRKLNGLTSDIDSIRFHSVNDIANANNSLMTEETRIELDMRLKSRIFDIRESWEDRYLAVKEFQDVLRNRGMNIEEHNDFYLKSTHLSGMNDSQLEVYRKMYQQPLNKAIRQLEKKGFSYRDIENYAILKHGVERNEWMSQNAINEYIKQHPEATPEQIEGYSKRLPKDYAGVTAVEQEVGATAEEFIAEFENQVGSDLVDSFWEKVNAATQFSLKKNLEGQLINQKTYDELIARYEYYIPLRGHDETVAEDRWDYTPQMGTFFVNPLVKANGRRSRSETPFAFIAQQAQSSITAANKNILTQTILRLANKDKTGLMSVSRAWYELKGEQDGQPLWEQVQAEYSSDPDTYRKNIEMFEAKMQTLAESGQAFQSGKKLNIGGLFIKPKQAEQHEVHVYQNGIDYVIYINANPAVAKAINGSNIKETSDVMKKVAKMSRFMAANFTTRNPIFVATNFSRDYIFASSILPVKESMKYALQFQKNIPEAVGALQRYIRNKADLTKEADRYMMEYIMNGAKTGYSHIVEIQSVQKEIEKDIKKGDHRNIAERIFQVFGAANEFAENLSRFSVYMTSRKDGRSIVRSVSDAKEVTVNFNRSGAGGTIANFVRPAYLFVNAGIQAFSNIVKVAVKNPKKISALFTFYTLSGAIMAPALALLLGGDDGLDDYYNLGEWERQNNLCLYTGKGFIKIPLPHELRVFHRTGDNILHALAGKKDVTEAMIEIPLGFSDLIPIDPMGAVEASWAEYTPDFMKPFTQLAANRNFMGGRIYNEWIDPNTPGYLKARTNKKGKPFTPDILVNTSKTLDNITGGDGVEQGLISINPDLVEHFARGYFGGLYSTAMQSINFTSKLAGFNKSGDITIRDTPLKTFFTSNEDLNVSSSGINNKFYKIKDEVKEIRRKIKGYENQANKGDISVEDFSAKISKLSKDIEKLQRVYPLMQEIDKHEKALKDLDGEDQKKVERAISDWKKQVIEINSIK